MKIFLINHDYLHNTTGICQFSQFALKLYKKKKNIYIYIYIFSLVNS